MNSFRLAAMSPLIRGVTVFMLLLQAVFVLGALAGWYVLWLPAALLLAIFTVIWCWFRPSVFVLDAEGLLVIWPWRQERLYRADVVSARMVGSAQLQSELGPAMRIGAGGLWGGFGLLKSRDRATMRMYISCTEDMVWVEVRNGRDWLISPEDPQRFVRRLSELKGLPS